LRDIAAALTRRNIPFVFVTGYGREALPESFGQSSVLTKPFTRSSSSRLQLSSFNYRR